MLMTNHQETTLDGSTGAIWLSELLRDYAEVKKERDCLITALQLSSQKVQHGEMFIALPGLTTDGREYIDQVLAKGVSAVLFENLGTDREDEFINGVPVIGVTNLKEKIGVISSRYYGNPSSQLKVIGVTGTNGKTTTAYLVAQALELVGLHCGYSGTIGSGFVGNLAHSDLTTIDAISMHRQLSDFLVSRAGAVSMEVSSHGLDQGRANGVDFDIAVFTNLSRDHLDYHESMTRYGNAKQKLFDFSSLGKAIINTDDAFGRRLHAHCIKKKNSPAGGPDCITYGLNSGDLQAVDLQTDAGGIHFKLQYGAETYEIHSKLLGTVNAPNVLATIGCLLALGYELPAIAQAISGIGPPPGRMEVFRNLPDQPAVVVDYAHTPDALERVLKSLRTLSAGKLVVVFGCGGDRDQGKRPEMGKVAESIADRVILTDDNPRTEPAGEIIDQIKAGLIRPVTVIHDRKLAVTEAINSSGANDFILLAGKGHEESQSIGCVDVALNDRVFVPELLEELA
jgi:UDP-N-acetylmuramoyl-L-alanyl-D-glutamate--2,6-diaminopimelate ligase